MAKTYHPRMHTAEHVLNQTMVRRFACGRCFSSHLNPDKSKCDYHFARPLEEHEAKALEAEVNAVLSKNLPVREYLLKREEAAQKVNLSRLPAAEKDNDNDIRIVEIGDYDICPCIGEHVQNTAETGAFILLSHSYTPDRGATPQDNPSQNRRQHAAAEAAPGILRLRFKLGKPL